MKVGYLAKDCWSRPLAMAQTGLGMARKKISPKKGHYKIEYREPWKRGNQGMEEIVETEVREITGIIRRIEEYKGTEETNALGISR